MTAQAQNDHTKIAPGDITDPVRVQAAELEVALSMGILELKHPSPLQGGYEIQGGYEDYEDDGDDEVISDTVYVGEVDAEFPEYDEMHIEAGKRPGFWKRVRGVFQRG